MSNFETAYNNKSLRDKFEKATKLKVDDNPTAFISFLNYEKGTLLATYLGEVDQRIKRAIDSFQEMQIKNRNK